MSFQDELDEPTAIGDADHFCRLVRARRERNFSELMALAIEAAAEQTLQLLMARGERPAGDLAEFYSPWPTRWGEQK